MPRKQRIGLENSATRGLLLDAAETLMVQDGYAAVTSRRLGEKAGISPNLVHYYFPTMEELFLSLFRRHSDRGLAAAAETLRSSNPLQAIWAHSLDRTFGSLHVEFAALGNHRKAVGSELTRRGEEFRAMQLKAVRSYYEARGVAPPIAPEAIVMLIASVGQSLAAEGRTERSLGYEETAKVMKQLLHELENGAPPAIVSLARSSTDRRQERAQRARIGKWRSARTRRTGPMET